MKTSHATRHTPAHRDHRVPAHTARAPRHIGPGWHNATVAAFAACSLAGCGGADAPNGPAVVKSVAGPGIPASDSPSSLVSASVSVSSPMPNNLPPASSAPVETPPVGASEPIAVAPSPASIPSTTPITDPVSTAPTVPATPIVLIDVYGDDSMFGGSPPMYLPNLQNEPAVAQALLQTQFNDTGITIANHATGGTSSSLFNELRGLDGNGAPFADRIKTSKAMIVVESHTLNDALGGETIDDYRQYLAQWIVDVRATGKIPVLEESGPVCDGDHPQLSAYVQAMDNVAAQYNVPVVPQYQQILALPNWCSHFAAGFYPDAYIQMLKAQNQAVAIAPLVQSVIANRS